MVERRSAQRLTPPVALSARVRAFIPARVVDISRCGVQVELSSLLRVGVSCDVRLLLDGVELCWPATVQRCKAAQFGLDERGQKVLLYRAGLQFAPMTDEEWAQLERFLVHGGARGTGIELDQHDVLAADGSADVREEKTRREGPIKVRVDPTRREG